MTIDEKNKFIEESKEHFKEWHDMNYISKADYETRLKADLKAILVELQLEIEEEAFDMVDLVYIPNTDSANVILMDDLNKIIQQKINSLKEAQNDRKKDI